MNERAVITGAAGFAGSHLVDLLTAEGLEVSAWYRPDGPQPVDPDPRASWRGVELLDEGAVSAAVRDVRPTAIFHCAGAAHVAASWTDTLVPLQTNALATHYLLKALGRFTPRARVLVPSSALVYGPSTAPLHERSALRPGTPYGVSKLAQEMVAIRSARQDNLHVVVARPFNHVGPRQDPSFVVSGFAQQIAEIERGCRAPVMRVGNLEARRDLTDVRDTIRAYRLLLDGAPPGQPLNVCSGQAYRIGDLLNRLLALTTASVEVVLDESRLRPSDQAMLLGSPAAIRREVGWSPEIPIERTLADTLDFWRARIARPDARR